MVVVSEPRKCLVGEGQNAKYVKECTEIFLGNKGIEKIRGFEDFVNIESLCLNGNKLKKINNLDNNFRIKVLNIQDNQLCTLKGSLTCFKNLEQLDLSNNQLRDLAKLLPILQRFQFLTHLNLKDNPCCEEPDYRLQMVHAMPGLRVLDQHVITGAERLKARAYIGGDVAALTVAFGQRAPPRLFERNSERSQLGQELVKEAGRARDAKLIREQDRELMQFSQNPHPDIPRGRSLPPNAGTRQAMQMYAQQAQTGSSGTTSAPTDTRHASPFSPSRGATAGTSGRDAWQGTASGGEQQEGDGGGKPAAYVPRDVFTLYSSKAGMTELQSCGTTLTRPLNGIIGFEQKKYEAFVTTKAAGTLGQWELNKKTLKL